MDQPTVHPVPAAPRSARARPGANPVKSKTAARTATMTEATRTVLCRPLVVRGQPSDPWANRNSAMEFPTPTTGLRAMYTGLVESVRTHTKGSDLRGLGSPPHPNRTSPDVAERFPGHRD